MFFVKIILRQAEEFQYGILQKPPTYKSNKAIGHDKEREQYA